MKDFINTDSFRFSFNCNKIKLPAWIDEAYVQALTGPVVFGGGIKKINWGRSNFLSVLDIVNPKDYSKPCEFYPEKIKKASPVFFLSAYLPKEMKLEFVYLPVFEADEFALEGRWKKNIFANIEQALPFSANKTLVEAKKKLFHFVKYLIGDLN